MTAATPVRAVLVFLDGVGIGSADPERNPLAAADLPQLRRLLGGVLPVEGAAAATTAAPARWVAADATLGVGGLPQSGTGQTALLTGENAPLRFGRHFGPWVPTALRQGLTERSLLRRFADAGHPVLFANAEPPDPPRRPIAPPLAARGAGLPPRGLAELVRGDAVASSVTPDRWRSQQSRVPVPEITPTDAATTLARLAGTATFTLFAHYDTDWVGHRGDLAAAVGVLQQVDTFLGALHTALPTDTLLLVASDHGNLEEVGAGHTRNPVPVLAAGPGSELVAERVRAITDLAPALCELFQVPWLP